MSIVPQRNNNISDSYNSTDFTYCIDFENGYVSGMCEGKKAVVQAIYKILSTERYGYVIYDRNYGIELRDLIGKPYIYVAAVIKGRIEEALLYDERITALKNFEMEIKGDALAVSFDVVTQYGTDSIYKKFVI